ncbi:DgyrCDS292 [Dimorphilus gyrociliatus]|uniref:DgyrCDS292 n=1 Tax=Dimorphilus gyrociliatus TaxID=2664684 RepID=A0A7I8V8J8_9ANNE|nr:DgyrCDS292 [Dimorphilus gyrociliatus]
MKYSILAVFLLIACTYAIDLGEKCAGDNSCKAENSECYKGDVTSSCVYGKCRCKTGYNNGPTGNEKECWQESDFDGSCLAADKKICDVKKHLECDNQNKCKCKSGFTEENRVCKADSIAYDQPCVDTLQCQFDNSICSGTPAKCVCAPGFYRNADVCVPKLEHDGDCSAPNENNCNDLKLLECTANKCACPAALFLKNGACTAGSKGDECAGTPEKTCGTNLVCEGNPKKCDCKTDFTEQTFNKQGVSVTECLHKDAKIDTAMYDKCDEAYTATGRFCSANLLCVDCYPGQTNRVCLNKKSEATTTQTPATTTAGATTTTTNFSSIAISLLSVAVIAFRV